MIPKKIYLNEQELHDAITCERMVSCNEPCRDMTEEYINLKQIWHDASEEPDHNRTIVITTVTNQVGIIPLGDNFVWFWDLSKDSVRMWAYISDLLPKEGKK